MRLAAELGLPVPRVEARVARLKGQEPQPYLLVERYDRHLGTEGRVERLHQEDFCQALGIPSLLKYQSEGGPNLSQCFDLVRNFSVQPAADAKHLQDVVIFNVLVGNADAHGKNFSILYLPAGPRLAPFYDLMSTAFYPDLDNNFAMKIGGQGEFRRLRHRAWQAFCEDAGLNFSIHQIRISAMAKKLPAATEQTRNGLANSDLDQDVLQDLAHLVCQRAIQTVEQIRDAQKDDEDARS
jgi:serine/threonine-protein kinase HipA